MNTANFILSPPNLERLFTLNLAVSKDVKTAAALMGVSAPTARKLLDAAVEEGLLLRTKPGRKFWYMPTLDADRVFRCYTADDFAAAVRRFVFGLNADAVEYAAKSIAENIEDTLREKGGPDYWDSLEQAADLHFDTILELFEADYPGTTEANLRAVWKPISDRAIELFGADKWPGGDDNTDAAPVVLTDTDVEQVKPAPKDETQATLPGSGDPDTCADAEAPCERKQGRELSEFFISTDDGPVIATVEELPNVRPLLRTYAAAATRDVKNVFPGDGFGELHFFEGGAEEIDAYLLERDAAFPVSVNLTDRGNGRFARVDQRRDRWTVTIAFGDDDKQCQRRFGTFQEAYREAFRAIDEKTDLKGFDGWIWFPFIDIHDVEEEVMIAAGPTPDFERRRIFLDEHEGVLHDVDGLFEVWIVVGEYSRTAELEEFAYQVDEGFIASFYATQAFREAVGYAPGPDRRKNGDFSDADPDPYLTFCRDCKAPHYPVNVVAEADFFKPKYAPDPDTGDRSIGHCECCERVVENPRYHFRMLTPGGSLCECCERRYRLAGFLDNESCRCGIVGEKGTFIRLRVAEENVYLCLSCAARFAKTGNLPAVNAAF